ncbi:hypothetical protein FLAVO9R_10109 [Flavobacterium sp. 9R]|nr:hypothetical protein FLAVO9R_10109 [Flavobacterium sp. 9R]
MNILNSKFIPILLVFLFSYFKILKTDLQGFENLAGIGILYLGLETSIKNKNSITNH